MSGSSTGPLGPLLKGSSRLQSAQSVRRPERPRSLRALAEGLLPVMLAAGPSLPLAPEAIRIPLI
eukprot:6056392-Alexandrium_andersonii.AAC.1